MNILDAIINLTTNSIYEIKEFYQGKNRANSMGESLEEYIKDLFAGTLEEKNERIRMNKLSEVFSYLGNQNNPPDIILKNGDAIEVKKIENRNSTLALNSSYPKAKLYSESPMITDACRTCEEWKIKDIIYAVGVLKNDLLSSLCFVYGIDYSASASVYERIKEAISEGILSINNIEFSETKELGRVNKVDPLGITYLRIRGMWGIENPMKAFEYVHSQDKNNKFNFMAIINEEKYLSFSSEKRILLENLTSSIKELNIKNIKIKTPDNPALLKKAKLITFFIEGDY
ncbi:MAG: NgoPII family restriction endonuclease [Fusobacteriaceae bacterium]